ncbi:MAG: hypothetical protein ACI9E1_002131 [Cryomorphaceae bacterium]|jgi:hypothetical protein
MKTNTPIRPSATYSTLVALALSSPLFAIERPTPALHPKEKAPSAVQVTEVEKALRMAKDNFQKIAYLGVFGEPISDTLATHLNLAKGIGIQLELVAGNSPAFNSGLRKHDIITSIAGKDISSLEDLQAAITDKKPGDEVTLNYISKGKAATIELSLGARTVPRAERADAGQMPQRNQQPQAKLGEPRLPAEFLNKFPKEDREKLMKLFKGNLEGLDLQELQQGLGKLEGFDLNLLPKGLNPAMNKGFKIKGVFNSRIKIVDKHGSFTLEKTKDGTVIELLDKEGKLQYRGPYNNEADRMSVPEDLRDRIGNLDIDTGSGFLGEPKIGNPGRNKMRFKLGKPKEGKDMPNMKDIEKELKLGQ